MDIDVQIKRLIEDYLDKHNFKKFDNNMPFSLTPDYVKVFQKIPYLEAVIITEESIKPYLNKMIDTLRYCINNLQDNAIIYLVKHMENEAALEISLVIKK